MATMRVLGVGLVALALGACSKQTTTDYAAGTPDVQGLVIETQGGVPATPIGPERLAPAGFTSDIPGTSLADARGAIGTLNDQMKLFLSKVEALAQTAPQVDKLGDKAVFGPVTVCVVGSGAGCSQATFYLGVKHEHALVFSWALEAGPAGSTDPTQYQPVAAGWHRVGALAHRGFGGVAINLVNMNAVVPAYPGSGYLLAGYWNGAVAKAVKYRLLGFTPDGTNPVTAAFVGEKNGVTGATRVRVAAIAEVIPPASGTDQGDELVLDHIGWRPAVPGGFAGGGVGFSVITNYGQPPSGDVPSGHYYLGRACYDGAGTLEFKEWFLCSRGAGETPRTCIAAGGGSVVVGTSWSTDCAFLASAADTELTPPATAGQDPQDTAAEPCNAADASGGTGTPPEPPASGDMTAAQMPGM